MNAKEFAHELEKAASFIRQQQAEIETLKQIIDANNLNQNIGQFVKPTNELADEVMEHYRAELPRGFNVNWMQEAATMLRQQQAEIEALKDKLMLAKQSLEIVEGWTKK